MLSKLAKDFKIHKSILLVLTFITLFYFLCILVNINMPVGVFFMVLFMICVGLIFISKDKICWYIFVTVFLVNFISFAVMPVLKYHLTLPDVLYDEDGGLQWAVGMSIQLSFIYVIVHLVARTIIRYIRKLF